MVPQNWIIHCHKMYKISDEVINFIEKTMQTWRVGLTAGGRSLAETKIQRGIFQGDTLSLLLFIMAMTLLTDGMELPNHDKIRTLGENETYKYLGISEAETIKHQEMKEKIQKEYLRRTRKLLETKLSSRNLIKVRNTWAVPLVRYSGPFLKWTRDELK